eukprot:541085_1
MGYILYNYPLNSLLNRVNDNNDIINGQKYISYYKQNKNWIATVTGWSPDNIYQIHSVLFRHNTFTKSQIIQNINNITLKHQSGKLLSNIIKTQIIPAFDMEILHYKIKHGKIIHQFSDAVINMVAQLIDNKDNGDFIKKAYDAIAHCFACNYDEKENNIISSILPPLHNCQDWTCSNCGNYNFVKLIGSNMNINLSVCTLCGMKQRDSIILQLKGCDTYVMVNYIDDEKNENDEKTGDNVDLLIQTAQNHGCSFDLKCLHRNDNKDCQSILRLAKYLIIYKRW